MNHATKTAKLVLSQQARAQIRPVKNLLAQKEKENYYIIAQLFGKVNSKNIRRTSIDVIIVTLKHMYHIIFIEKNVAHFSKAFMVKFEQVIATLSSYCVAKTYVLAQFLTTYLVWKYQFTIFILLKNGFLYVIAFILISQIGKKIYSKYIVQ